jgi:hypothetical protein
VTEKFFLGPGEALLLRAVGSRTASLVQISDRQLRLCSAASDIGIPLVHVLAQHRCVQFDAIRDVITTIREIQARVRKCISVSATWK